MGVATMMSPNSTTPSVSAIRRVEGMLSMNGTLLVRITCTTSVWVINDSMNQPAWKSCWCAGVVAALAPPTPGGPPAVRGVLDARLLTDAANPRTFHLWERYDSNRTLGEVNTGEPYAAFMKAVAPLLEGPVGMALYEWKDGHLGAPAVQGGPKGEGGLDDATGGQGMPGGAGMKQTSATVDLGNLERGEEGDAFGMPPASKGGAGGGGEGGDGDREGGPLNAFEEFQENLAKGLKAFKFPWEK